MIKKATAHTSPGIIAGFCPPWEAGKPYKVATYLEEEGDDPQIADLTAGPSGVAPLAKLLNIKVLNDDGTGSASAAIRGLEYLRKLNDASQDIQVDGVNMSLGYPFDPKSYGCGYSPLCQEVTRAVESGLIVVISCGNWGYGKTTMGSGEQAAVTVVSSITDPANTEAAITVGSVHKSKPHRYGVSYFSSKGPTADGRMKPDLVAPGREDHFLPRPSGARLSLSGSKRHERRRPARFRGHRGLFVRAPGIPR